jgi:hypothetical protein
MRPARTFALIVCLVFVGGLVAACGSGGEDASGGNISVVDPRLVQLPDGSRAFSGVLVNGRSETIEVAQVEIALYDDQGGKVETMRIQVDDIAPDDSAQFKTTIDSGLSFSQAQVQKVLTP